MGIAVQFYLGNLPATGGPWVFWLGWNWRVWCSLCGCGPHFLFDLLGLLLSRRAWSSYAQFVAKTV